MTLRSALTIAIAFALASAVACGGGDDSGLPTATIVLTDDKGSRAELTVELPRTGEEFSRGLMFREGLPEDHGMLFVFAGETMGGFWMKDTSIPLSIAFLDKRGVVVDIYDMQPFSLNPVRSTRKSRYAIEVNRNFFRDAGLTVGDSIDLSMVKRR